MRWLLFLFFLMSAQALHNEVISHNSSLSTMIQAHLSIQIVSPQGVIHLEKTEMNAIQLAVSQKLKVKLARLLKKHRRYRNSLRANLDSQHVELYLPKTRNFVILVELHIQQLISALSQSKSG
ncbi:hypothetical protein BY458DRAFT_550485 [Sporodiniella umbellata]|nr:hypothetical protein BY458DRAFT_550485 [Sporodiniella umbellata]